MSCTFLYVTQHRRSTDALRSCSGSCCSVVRVLKHGINGTCRMRLDVNVSSIEKRHERNAFFHLWCSRVEQASQSLQCHGALIWGHEVMSMQRCTATAPWAELVFPPPRPGAPLHRPRPDWICHVPHSELLEEIPSPHHSSTYRPLLRVRTPRDRSLIGSAVDMLCQLCIQLRVGHALDSQGIPAICLDGHASHIHSDVDQDLCSMPVYGGRH